MWRPADDGRLYDVVLLGAKDKLSAIRAVRAAPPDVGLIAARQMIERLPATLRSGVSAAEAARLRGELEKLGGRVEVRPAAGAAMSDAAAGGET
jgi:ribosomal protein L7/L12